MHNEQQVDATLSHIGATTAYTGAGTSVLGGLMLNEVAMIVGMVVGVAGLLVNWYFKYRLTQAQLAALLEKCRRDEEAHQYRMRMFNENRIDPSTEG